MPGLPCERKGEAGWGQGDGQGPRSKGDIVRDEKDQGAKDQSLGKVAEKRCREKRRPAGAKWSKAGRERLKEEERGRVR